MKRGERDVSRVCEERSEQKREILLAPRAVEGGEDRAVFVPSRNAAWPAVAEDFGELPDPGTVAMSEIRKATRERFRLGGPERSRQLLQRCRPGREPVGPDDHEQGGIVL